MSAAISYRLTVHGRKFVGTRLGVTSHYAVGVAQAECIMSMPVTQASRAIRDVATAFEHIDSCWGFYPEGDKWSERWSYVLSGARTSIDHHIERCAMEAPGEH